MGFTLGHRALKLKGFFFRGSAFGALYFLRKIFRIISPNSVSTLRGSCGRCKGRCLFRVLTLGRSIFLVNFRIKSLVNVEVHFVCACSRKECVCVCPRSGLNLGRGIFPVNFRINRLL